ASIALHSSRAASKLCSRSCHGRPGVLSAAFRMKSTASVVRRSTIGGLARMGRSGSIGKVGITRQPRASAKVPYNLCLSMNSAGRAIKTVVHLEFPLEAEGRLLEERRVAVKAPLSRGLNAAPCIKGSVKASGSASFHQAQELISGNGRLSYTSMLFNRRHSAASARWSLAG